MTAFCHSATFLDVRVSERAITSVTAQHSRLSRVTTSRLQRAVSALGLSVGILPMAACRTTCAPGTYCDIAREQCTDCSHICGHQVMVVQCEQFCTELASSTIIPVFSSTQSTSAPIAIGVSLGVFGIVAITIFIILCLRWKKKGCFKPGNTEDPTVTQDDDQLRMDSQQLLKNQPGADLEKPFDSGCGASHLTSAAASGYIPPVLQNGGE